MQNNVLDCVPRSEAPDGQIGSGQTEPKSFEDAAFLQAHLPLVQRVVKRLHASLPPSVELDDLYSVGVIGLVHAAKNYRPGRGTTFNSYATHRIRGAVLDELRRADFLPRRARSKARQLFKTVAALEQELGRAPEDAEIAHALGISLREYYELEELVTPKGSVELDGAMDEDLSDDAGLHEIIADSQEETAFAKLEKKELVETLAQLIQRLPETQKKVLAMYYFEELRLAEIAAVFGVTESRISQIHSQAVAVLRKQLQAVLAR
jgi:RNA polymerase sigma factor for flagellar operon FliA